jgi:hypothetical protein
MSKNKLLFEKMFGGRRERFETASPFEILRRDASKLRTQLPMRIVIGTADGLLTAAKRFDAQLRESAYEHELEFVEGVPHNVDRLYEAVGAKGLAFHARANGWR